MKKLQAWILAVALAYPALADAQSHAVKRCLADGRTLLAKLEGNGNYLRTYKRWVKTCAKRAETQPEYAGVLAQYKKLKPIGDKGLASEVEEGAIQKAFEEAWPGLYADHLLRDKNSRDYKRAIKSLERCVKVLGPLLAKYPAAKTAKVGRGSYTGQSLYDSCNGGFQAKAAAKQGKRAAGQVAFGKKFIMKTEHNFAPAVKALEKAQKVARSKRPYSALWALNLYDFALRDMSEVASNVQYGLKSSAALKDMTFTYSGKTITGGELLKLTWGHYNRGKNARKKLKGKAQRQEAQWQKKFKSQLKGDRRKTIRRYGMPSAWDGSNFSDPLKKLKNAARGKWWIYRDSGCTLTVSFSGNRATSRVLKPLLCALRRR